MLQEIYIIDDESELLSILKELFKKEEEYVFKSVKTEDIDEALKNIPALIIVHEDGIEKDIIELGKQIRENEDNTITPIIVVSSNTEKEHRIDILKTAVEYFIKEKFDALNISKHKEYIHFGLTSQDINNTSVPLSLKDCNDDVLLPMLDEIIDLINAKATEWKDVPMLAHTHGQPASPTCLGKEIKVFAYRLEKQLAYFSFIPFSAKFGGATGNFNAHNIAFPDIDWTNFADEFVASLGLERDLFTTQIENYDNLAAYFDNLRRINTILIDFCRDIWLYISMEYFKQKIKEGEVGSSAMPHKVNPIDFENAEGNLGMANAILTHLSMKMPISRLQRDLTDSTVSRNIGIPLAHTLIALDSLKKGINKLILNETALEEDLENNWAVVAEGLQTILRSIDYPNPYETLKQLTRKNTKMNKQIIHEFIDTLQVSDEIKQRMKQITPHNYIGIYPEI